MNTMSFDLTGRRGRRVEQFLATTARALKALGQGLRMDGPGVPATSVRLLELAAAYEASQPGYAADLRAAAARAEDDEGAARR